MVRLLLSGLLHLAAVRDSGAVGIARFAAVDVRHADTVVAMLWYPSIDSARATALGLHTLELAPDGRLAVGAEHRPLIVISHGTGGNEFGHWDTAEALARAGFIVVTLRHAGDNSSDDSGLGTDRFAYGRATQVTALLDALLADAVWGARIDARRIGFLGFSAGGYTGLLLLGGRPDFARLGGYCRQHASDPLYCADGLRGPFRFTGRYEAPAPDGRVRSAALLAPALGFLFDSAGLATIRRPVLLMRAERDSVVREPENVAWVAAHLPARPAVRVVPGAGHYVFLAPCSPRLARVAPAICRDPAGVARPAVHAELNAALVKFFDHTLR